MVVPKIHSQNQQQQKSIVGKGSRRIPLQPQIEEIASSNTSSSYYIVLLVKIILVLVILFTLPKFVTTTITNTTTNNDRTDDGSVTTQHVLSKMTSSTSMKNGSSNNRSSRNRQRQKRFQYKLRSLRKECQNNSTISNCSIMIPEESLNCVNQCISTYCYMKVFNSTVTLSRNGSRDNTANFFTEDYIIDEDLVMVQQQQQREPLEDGEIDVVRAKEFDACAIEEMMQRFQQQKQQQINIAA